MSLLTMFLKGFEPQTFNHEEAKRLYQRDSKISGQKNLLNRQIGELCMWQNRQKFLRVQIFEMMPNSEKFVKTVFCLDSGQKFELDKKDQYQLLPLYTNFR